MLLVASETGHVYTFATRKLQPMITSDAGKALIQTCLNSPDPPAPTPTTGSNDQRMSATGYEETELTYNVADDVAAAAEQQQKVRQMMYAANSHYSVAAAAHNLFPTPTGQHPGAPGGPLPPHQSPMNSNMQQHASSSPYGHPAPSPSPSALHHPSTYGVSSLSPTTVGLSSHSPGPSAHHLATSHSPPFIPQHSVAGRWLASGGSGEMPDCTTSAGWVPQLYPQYGWTKPNPPLPPSQGLVGSPSPPGNSNQHSTSSSSSAIVSSSAIARTDSRFEDVEEKSWFLITQ